MSSVPDHGMAGDTKEDCRPSEQTSRPTKDVLPKRRTKTGCLTCRKRRIKCDEERPVCKNCRKSKRECAGYNHPFHEPLSSMPMQWTHEQAYDPVATINHANAGRQHSISMPVTNNLSRWDQIEAWTLRSLVPESTPVDILQHGVPGHNHMRSSTHPSQPVSDLMPLLDPRSVQPKDYNEAMAASALLTENASTPATHGKFTAQENGHSMSKTLRARYNNHGFIESTMFTHSIQQVSPATYSVPSVPPFMDEGEDAEDPWDVIMDECSSYDAHHNHPQSEKPLNNAHIRSRMFGSQTERSTMNQCILMRQPLNLISPLLEERSQTIFKHFLSTTGPCMGTFDRHDAITDGMPGMIWTNGLPAMALSSPALAHAILAVGAIHMSKLNLINENIAVKHFTYALRRVGNSLADARERLEVSTLATVLLLGYYEVMAGDHSRWNLHLSGAVKLIMEHNYAGFMRAVNRTRAGAKSEVAQLPSTFPQPILNQSNTPMDANRQVMFHDSDWDVDQNLVSKLMGVVIDYDTQVQPNFQAQTSLPKLDGRNLKEWKVLTELYWWYCRQDVFMSLLSGDRLLLPYSQWRYCAPRGPINNVDNPNTTCDHLWLLIARLADFGGRDRRRKQRIVNMHGGNWVPPPGFLERSSSSSTVLPRPNSEELMTAGLDINKPPSANEGRPRKAKQSVGDSTSRPAFYGMMPPEAGPIQMPSSFTAMSTRLKGTSGSPPTDADSPSMYDLEAQTQQALDEHASMVKAFELFESLLSPEYQPLPASVVQTSTPFGPALTYRSPIIAAMWTFLLVGKILLRRMHPHSPPAAMMSAGVNAHFTHSYAQTIGRVCGGLFAQHKHLLQSGYCDNVLAGAVMETTFSLLFAAVQYHDPAQRGWTISKLSEIAQIMGWQTSAAVAGACETTWEKAGELGRGPPYLRTMDINNPDARLNGKYRRVYSHQNTSNPRSTVEEHESRFVSHDRSLIDKHASTRAHWALGLLSVEEDLRKMSLKETD